jgi:penicillin-binding protein 1A
MLNFAPGRYQKLIRRIWRGTLVGLGLLIVYVIAVSVNLFWLFGGMPSLKALENPRSEEASLIYSSDYYGEGVVQHELLGKYFLENREPVELTQVSPNVTSALLATEDARFAKHSGIDPRSVFRALFGFLTGDIAGGGSTLTQQTAKNLFETRGEEFRGVLGNIPLVRTVIAKTKEWILAVRLEQNYTKQEIMMMYLNTVSFGNNTYGIKTAAKTFFNKEPWKLNVEEAALLVGMLQNPSLYDPRIFEDKARRRRNVVLSQMQRYGFLTMDQFVQYKIKPLRLDFSVENQNSGLAAYFRSVLRDDVKAVVKQYNDENGTDYNIYTSGLRIYTTIDSRMQRYMEEAVMEHMRDQQRKFYEHWRGRNPWVEKDGRTDKFVEQKGFIEKAARNTSRYKALKAVYKTADGKPDDAKIFAEMRKKVKMRVFTYGGRRNEKDTTISPMDSIRYYKRLLNIGMMSMDPNNGYVKAWVGGVNFKYMKFDHVRQGRRQPGSTFKPFVYLTALNNEYISPCRRFTDRPTTFAHGEDNNGGPSWTPKNSTGGYSYRSLSLREALGQSVNTVSAQLIKMTRSKAVVETARKLGVNSPLTENPTLCLGTSDVSVFEMVGAYCTFANGGYRVKPMVLVRITDKNGNVLKEFSPDANQVINANKAYDMLYLMRGAVEEPSGTSQRLRSQYKLAEGGNEIGAKTGTTSNYSDGWFMGMTQHLVSGLWVGGDDRGIHFRNIEYGQGARIAMPAWALFMQKVYKDPTLPTYKPEPFRKPDGYRLDCGGYYIDSASRYIPPKVVPQDEEELLN